MPSAHAKLSASGSNRWLHCTASIRACDTLPVNHQTSSTNAAAEEGTCAHELADLCLRNNCDPSEYLYQHLTDAPDVMVTAEMVNYIDEYVQYCRSLGGEQFPEEKVNFDDYVPEGFGTSDFIAINGATCDIVDLKYGKGEVSAIDNPQAKLYALGVLQEFDFLDITQFNLHIYQPRIGNISVWSISTDDLIKWGVEVVKPKAHEAFYGPGVFSPGDKQCQWCAYKGHCESLLKYTADMLGSELDTITDTDDLLNVDSINIETAAHIVRNKSLITSWLTAVEKRVYEALDNGNEVPGYKLVAGRSSRKWSNESEVVTRLADRLGEGVYEKKVLSAPKLEKVLGKAEFNDLVGDLVTKQEGKPTVAPETDKRKNIKQETINDLASGL